MPPQIAPGSSRRLIVRRLSRTTAYSAVELVLLSLLAIQSARLVYTLVTPVGPVGAWQAPGSARPAPALASDLAAFDPFFRLSQASGAPAVVTSLNLQLFGVREDRATGRGSAIIATADGTQRSFLVGEEIMPGVTLVAVGFDNVTIARGAVREQIFLDQSGGPDTPAVSAPAPAAPGNSVNFAPQPATQPAPVQVPVVTAPPAPPPPASPPPAIRNGTGQ